MINAQVAAWVLTILLALGCIINIVKSARKNSDGAVIGSIIADIIQIYLYYCVGIFSLL